jgi:SPP1 gp7 family putative phage head morphogenesis protein
MIKTETDFYGVKLSVDELLKTKWGNDKLNWKTRLNNQVNLQKLKVKNRLKVAFVRGDSISTLIDDLEDEFEKFSKQLWSLYETEANAITSEARYKILKEKGFRKFQYYARLDERTCTTCGAMHGNKFPMSSFQIGVTAPPMHPHCRCWITELKG